MDDVWLLITSCLEGGENNLKVSALISINRLLDTCGLPVAVEVSAQYLLSCHEPLPFQIDR